MTYGITPAGFNAKPLAQIVADVQARIVASLGAGAVDFGPQSPDGQFVEILCEPIAEVWELGAALFNIMNRGDVEGAALDNLGDLTGIAREGQTYTTVQCVLTISASDAPYAAGALIANVAGNASETFTNPDAVTSSMISGGTATVTMQATTIGPTPAVLDGTLNAITAPVTGWTAINNPGPGSQLTAGTNAELDPAYAVRQAQEVSAEGSCNPNATASAIAKYASDNGGSIAVSMIENQTSAPLTVNGVTLPANTFLPVVYDSSGIWLAATNPTLGVTNAQAIANLIYANKPAGIATAPIGTAYTVTDSILGPQTVYFAQPTGVPLYITATAALLAGYTISSVQTNARAAFAKAAVAPTPSGGTPPPGQLAPGAYVIGSQLSAVLQSVAGVLDVQSLTFGTSASPVTSTPLAFNALQVATIVALNILINQGTGP